MSAVIKQFIVLFYLPISHNMLQSKMWKTYRDFIFCKYVIQICVGINRILVGFLIYFYTTMYPRYMRMYDFFDI